MQDANELKLLPEQAEVNEYAIVDKARFPEGTNRGVSLYCDCVRLSAARTVTMTVREYVNPLGVPVVVVTPEPVAVVDKVKVVLPFVVIM